MAAEQDEVASKVLRRAQVSKVRLSTAWPLGQLLDIYLLTLRCVDDPHPAEPPRSRKRQDQERLGEPQSG
jgi:hypothetical protein